MDDSLMDIMKTQHRPIQLFLCLAMSVWLAGCADMGGITPRSHLTDPNSLGAGKDFQAGSNSPANWPTARWWETYHDPQLNTLVEKAIADSPNLKIAAARVDEAQAIAGIVHSASLPKVDGRVGLGRIRYSEQDFIPPPYAGHYTWTNSAFVSASYDLDIWGKESKSESGALDNVHASEAEAQESRVALETLVVHAYVDLSLQYALRDTEQRTLTEQQKIVEIANRRREIGLGTQLEISQAEAPIPVTQSHLKQINEQIESLHHQLAALSGAGPAAGDLITRPTLSPVTSIALPSSLPAELVGHRPDVVANRWRVEASARGIDVAKTEFYPNVDLTAMFGFQSLGFPGFLSNNSRMDGITPAISLPIFNGGKLRSQLGVQTARYDQAVERYNASVIDAMRNVADQVSLWRSLEEQQQDTQRAVELAQRSYDLAVRGYQSGLTEYINVLSAQVNLLNQQQNDAKVRFGQLNAYAGLVRSLGGGTEQQTGKN
jgi:NodT family efflux transporter outer membrane factor (OMF) lipoprotein